MAVVRRLIQALSVHDSGPSEGHSPPRVADAGQWNSIPLQDRLEIVRTDYEHLSNNLSSFKKLYMYRFICISRVKDLVIVSFVLLRRIDRSEVSELKKKKKSRCRVKSNTQMSVYGRYQTRPSQAPSQSNLTKVERRGNCIV